MKDAGRLSADLRLLLPAATVGAWEALSPHLPRELYLGGGTAVAIHLRHRQSADLDFFYHRASVDLDQLEARLGRLGPFAATHRAPGTLRGLFGHTKVEFLHADELRPQRLLEEPTVVAGLRVARRKDLMAMKLKVVGDRGELRDYFDMMKLDQEGVVSLEDGIALFLERYGLNPAGDALTHLVQALGYLDDVEEDEALPIGKPELAKWWQGRQVRLVRELGRMG
ncbi:MAG: nucleotidyl transferase AbiEii/AbiGii toxin family protein [Solirubrobacteraceae bacterium]